MVIAHVVSSLDPAAGGLPAVAARVAAAQVGLGHDVRLVYHAWGRTDPGADEAYRRVPGFRTVHLQPLRRPTRLDVLAPRAIRRSLHPMFAGADVVHCHGVWDPICRAAADVARARGVPYVVAPHGMLDPWSLAQRRVKKRVALALAYRRMLDGAAFLQALNADERDLMAPLRVRAPVEVVPNGVFPEELDPLPPPGAFTAARPALRGKRVALFLARLHHKKGLDVLADAWALVRPAVPDAALVVAGPDDGARADFERQVRGSEIAGSVHVVGPLYGSDKWAALVDAACVVLPSRQEGFSMTILEALACGTPVVISTACHFPEVVEVGAGQVVELVSAAVAAGLAAVLSADDARRAAMGAAGRALVHERYTWPAVARQLVTLYGRARNE